MISTMRRMMRRIKYNRSELEDVRQTVLREHSRVSLNVYDLPHELRMQSDLKRMQKPALKH